MVHALFRYGNVVFFLIIDTGIIVELELVLVESVVCLRFDAAKLELVVGLVVGFTHHILKHFFFQCP